jgi:prevent-host-death family protein
VPAHQPSTRTVKASEARQQWSQLLNSVFRREARVVVEKSGIPVAALISITDLEWLERFQARRARDFAILEESQAAFKDVPPDEIEREVAKAIAEVRAENRERRRVSAETA